MFKSKLAFQYLRNDQFKFRNAIPFARFHVAKSLGSAIKFDAPKRGPVIIIGCGRSGTTTLKEVLSGHPKLAPAPWEGNELWHPNLYPWRSTDGSVPPIWADPFAYTSASLKGLSENQKSRLVSVYGAYDHLTPGTMVLLKSAMVAFMIPYIIEQFPNCKLIHLYRDGRAVALSLAKKQQLELKAHPAAYSSKGYGLSDFELLQRMARLWVEHITEIDEQDRALGLTKSGRMISISYEAFCQNPAGLAAQIGDFLGLDPNKFNKNRFAEVKGTNYKFAREMEPGSLSKITEIMQPTLIRLGYEI